MKRMYMLIVLFALLIMGGASYWIYSQPTYPKTAAGTFYSEATLTSGGTKVSLPRDVADQLKLVFIDLQLKQQTRNFTFQSRTIPLSEYRSGEYLPLIVISTPSSDVIAGIRVCEPCGSFSFHIVEGRYLDCDSCHTRWNIETLKGVSGSCTNYPPPKLPSLLDINIEIDLTQLDIAVAT